MRFLLVLFLLEACICAKGCKIGWIRFHSKCYMFSHTVATWAEAESLCSAFHSVLAEPRSHEESMFLISHSENEAGHFWIGISDIIEEDRWIYSSDQQPIQVNDFHASQPNDHTSANCVALYKPFHGHWADEPCTTRYNFICESPQENVYCYEYAIAFVREFNLKTLTEC